MHIKRFRGDLLEARVSAECVIKLSRTWTIAAVQVSDCLRLIFAGSSRAERPAGDGAWFATRDLGDARAHA